MNCSFSKDRIRISSRGVITGILFISVGDHSFPDNGWDDFVLRVLSMWGRSAINLLNGKNQEEFLFMDGSFSFKLEKIDALSYKIEGLYYGLNEIDIVFEDVILLDELLKEIIQVQEALFSYIADNNWAVENVNAYVNQLNILKQGISRTRKIIFNKADI